MAYILMFLLVVIMLWIIDDCFKKDTTNSTSAYIIKHNKYLVFLNGLLQQENQDYKIVNNILMWCYPIMSDDTICLVDLKANSEYFFKITKQSQHCHVYLT